MIFLSAGPGPGLHAWPPRIAGHSHPQRCPCLSWRRNRNRRLHGSRLGTPLCI